MKDTIFAHTPAGGEIYPAYLNISLEDGRIVVTLRGNAVETTGVRVCGVSCHPGGEACNNYCNQAPQKGPMAPRPASYNFMKEGATVSASFDAEEWIEAWQKQIR